MGSVSEVKGDMKLVWIILLFISVNGISQQDAIYSQYMFNPFAINPGYAGSRNSANAVLINRSQWIGLDGAPTTQTLSAHVPMNNKNLAWGINLSHDKLGPTRNLLAVGTAAYQLKFDNATLNFGLRGGVYNGVIDQGALLFREDNDVLDTKQKLSSVVPTFDFGLYYYSDRFYAGLSVNHLTKHRFKYAEIENNVDYFLRRHIFFMIGNVFELNNNILLKPSILIKSTKSVIFDADFNLNVMFNELFWIGVGIRNFSSINFLIDFNVTDYLRIGYSYDMNLNKIKNYSHGSHELLLGFDFNLKSSANMLSPRYL